MEIKKTDKGWEVDGIPFQTREVAERYRDSDLEEADTSWLDEKIEFVYDSEAPGNPSFKVFISEYALANCLSMKKIAEKLEVSRPTLYNWMDGQVIPEPKNIDKICVTLGASKVDVMRALIDNFRTAYPELLSQVALDRHECEALLGSLRAESKLGLASVLEKIESIQKLMANAPISKRA